MFWHVRLTWRGYLQLSEQTAAPSRAHPNVFPYWSFVSPLCFYMCSGHVGCVWWCSAVVSLLCLCYMLASSCVHWHCWFVVAQRAAHNNARRVVRFSAFSNVAFSQTDVRSDPGWVGRGRVGVSGLGCSPFKPAL